MLVLTGRPEDAWLATWSRADAAVPHPIDPRVLADAAAQLLRRRLARSRGLTATADGPAHDLAVRARAPAAPGRLSAERPPGRWTRSCPARPLDAQIAGFVVALRAKGETAEEMDGLAAAMLGHAHRIDVPGPAVDVVGTGGDLAHTVNVSTMAAIVVAGTGARVVKHGNRAASSACGTADVLEELGLPLDADARAGGRGSGPRPASRSASPGCSTRPCGYAAGVRSELGVPTVFNFLGPLTNPAQPGRRPSGARTRGWPGVMAGRVRPAGSSALVFRGDDGLDELTTTTTSHVWWVRDGDVDGARRSTRADARHRPGDAGGAARRRPGVQRRRRAPAARRRAGPVRDAVLLNAAAALVALDGGDGDLGGAAGPRRTSARPRPSTRDAAAATLARWLDAARSVAEAGLGAVAEAERERGLEVVAGVGAERDVGLGGEDAVDVLMRPGMTSASSSCSRTRTMATRSTSPVTE